MVGDVHLNNGVWVSMLRSETTVLYEPIKEDDTPGIQSKQYAYKYPQAASKELIKEAEEVQHKRKKTANQESTAKREESSWEEWTTRPRADCFK